MEHRKLSAESTHARATPTGPRPLAGRSEHAGREARDTRPRVLQFQAVDLRQQVQIGSLLKLTGPFASSHWVVGSHGRPDALVIGLGTEEGRLACQANQRESHPLPVLLLGTQEQALKVAGCKPAGLLLLSPPFRHLSLLYCLDALARQCAAHRGHRGRPGAPAQPLRALVVDDSPTVRTQLSNVIMRIGMQCDLADGAAEALARLDAAHYDLIVVDVLMPDMDGYKLTREIKRGRTHKHAPVIILTSQSSPFDRARGALAGCDIYLAKPVGVKAFFEAATKALRKSMAVDDLSPWLTEPGAPRPTGNGPQVHHGTSAHLPEQKSEQRSEQRSASPRLAHAGADASFPPVVKLQSR
ncbi:MAG TPA: response regulator [Burkholderiaceae bacterium]|nr:response regulator [Burkholderiaceae bacterium]